LVLIQDWLKRRYELLINNFGENPFRFEEASKLLEEKNKDQQKEVPVFLSELRKAGLLRVESDPNDARKKIYRMVPEERLSKEFLTIKSEKLSRGEVESLLKKAADLIRTRVDYKFILILLFMKRISDKWTVEYERAYKEALEAGLTEEEAKREAKKGVYHEFDLPEEYLWDNLRKDVVKLSENFSRALKEMGERNPDLKDVVDSVEFYQFALSRENSEILRQLVELFSEKRLHEVSPDILGDAYEWILRYFAPTKAKEGEIYTPREVIALLVKMLDPKPGESVYDPACGSAGMLIAAHNHVSEKYGEEEAKRLFLYGQEANQKTLALAKMNMYIHDILDSNLMLGDTLLYPKFKEGDGLKKFNVVIANPPWNQDGYDEEVLKKGEFWRQRFGYGFPPRQSADWAWIQHMLASANEGDGRVGVVIDNGALFRGGKERSIRLKALESDLVECVILLPEKLFYNTGAPGAIIVFRKQKPEERKDKIVFINASKEFEQHPEVRKLNILGKGNIEKIVNAYKSFSEEPGFARVVGLDEIRQNDYNLNVTLYVIADEEGEQIDITKEYKELKELEKERQVIAEKLEQHLREIAFAVGEKSG